MDINAANLVTDDIVDVVSGANSITLSATKMAAETS